MAPGEGAGRASPRSPAGCEGQEGASGSQSDVAVLGASVLTSLPLLLPSALRELGRRGRAGGTETLGEETPRGIICSR